MPYETLQYNGVEKSFNAWGISSRVTGRKRNQAADDFIFEIPLTTIAAEAAAPTFPFEAQIIVRSNRASATGAAGSFSGGTVKFQGKRVGQPVKSSASGQGVEYRFSGPWYDLENTSYQQNFLGANGLTYVIAEAVLNTSTAVAAGQVNCSVGDQLQAILQWLLDQYAAQGFAAPFQYRGRTLNAGAIDLNTSAPGVYNFALDASPTISPAFFSLFFPSYITKPMSCAAALSKCLEFSPRANLCFDHTTTPPTAYIKLPAEQTQKTLPLFDGVSHKSISIQRRDDLKVRAVNIIYRITSTVNGATLLDYAQDKWGPNGSNAAADPQSGLRVINDLVDLSGGSVTTSQAHLDVEPILAIGGTQATKRAWWASKRGGEAHALEDLRCRFQDRDGNQTTIPDATVYDAKTGAILAPADLVAAGFCDKFGNLVLNRLVRGTHHAWMVRNDGQPVVSKKVKLVARMQYAEYDVVGASDTDQTTGNRKSQRGAADHHVNIEITNGVTQAYSTISSFTAGESYIIGAGGIAQYLFNHLNAYQYDGEAVHVAAEFADAGAANYIDLGCCLNLSNGSAEWAAMNAQIQMIEEDYFTHEIRVQIGVAKHLNAGQLSSLLNLWHNRRPWYNPLCRTNNALAGSGLVDQPIAAGQANSVAGLQVDSAMNIITYTADGDPTTPILGSINLDAQLIKVALAATTPIALEA